MIFIDNDAARASLAKSFTRKEEGARIVFEAVEAEERLDVQAFCEFPLPAILQTAPVSPIRLKLRKSALKVGGGVVLALVARHGCVFPSIHALHGLSWHLFS